MTSHPSSQSITRGLVPTAGTVQGLWRLWLSRYLWQDLTGTIVCLLAGSAAHAATGRLDATVVAGLIGENVGFYGVAWLRARRRGESLRCLADEYLCAELLDACLVRPFALALGAGAFDSPAIGLFVGGCVADQVFYAVAGVRALRRAQPPEAEASSPGW